MTRTGIPVTAIAIVLLALAPAAQAGQINVAPQPQANLAPNVAPAGARLPAVLPAVVPRADPGGLREAGPGGGPHIRSDAGGGPHIRRRPGGGPHVRGNVAGGAAR